MNLLSLKVRNFLRIEAAEITPDGAVVEISGANEAGKSSLLRAFVCALSGKDSIPADPVRHGADEALIELDLDELRIKLVIRPDRSTVLTVTNAEGFKATSPQKLLDGLYSKLIDPLAFARLTPKQQRDTVAEMAGLSAMLDELARADAEDRDARRDVNRDLKAAHARLDAMPEVAAVEPVDVSATLAEIRDAREENRVAEALAARLAQLQSQAADAREVAERKRAQAHALLVEAEQCDGQASVLDASASLIMVPAAIDLTPLERRLEDAETINAQHRAYADREFLAKTVADYAAESQAYTDALTAREAERKAVIEAADLPIPGLGFGDDCLTYDGVRFDQASTAVTTRVCTAIAMAMSAKIRVLLVKDWSLLDQKNRQIVTEMAQERGFLVIAEVVDESGEVGVFIEDGRVVAVNGQAVEVAP
jgi:hypothetical protein